MRPLPLAAFLIGLVSPALAQMKTEVRLKVETVSGVTGASDLQAPTALVYTAPTLSAASIAPTPVFTPETLTLATVLAPSVIVPQTLKTDKPIAPKALTVVRPAALAEASFVKALEQGGTGKRNAALVELRDLAMRQDGEKKAEPEATSAGGYLRFDKPLPFGAEEAARYEDTLGYGTSDDRRVKDVVDAAAALLTSGGVEFTRVGRLDDDGRLEESLVILPLVDGSDLNKLAWNLRRRHGTSVEYSPLALGRSHGKFVSTSKTLFLPHFGRSRTFQTVLHEARHSKERARRAKGVLSPFDARAVSRNGFEIVPQSSHYSKDMPMEELLTHAQDFKLTMASARRKTPTAGDEFGMAMDIIELQDLRRNAFYTAARMLSLLEEGAEVTPVEDKETLEQLGPILGGSWFKMILPWSTVFLPVLDEAPAPAKKGLARLFSRKPPTPGQKAAKRTALALKAWAVETGPAIDGVIDALGTAKPDWKKLNALVDEIVAAGWKAKKDFDAAK